MSEGRPEPHLAHLSDDDLTRATGAAETRQRLEQAAINMDELLIKYTRMPYSVVSGVWLSLLTDQGRALADAASDYLDSTAPDGET